MSSSHPIGLRRKPTFPRRRWFSIANQLRYGLVLTVISSVLLTGGMSVYLSFRHDLKQTQSLQKEQSSAAATKISAYLDTLQRQINYLSELRGFAEFDEATQASLLDGLVNSNSAFEMVGILDPQGRVVRAVSPYESISPETLELSTLAPDSYTLKAVLSGQNFVSSVKIDPEIQLPVATLAVPIRNNQNQIAGVLFAKINLNFLAQITARTQVGETGYSYVVDDRSVLIARSTSTDVLQLPDLSDRPFIQKLSNLARSSNTQPTLFYEGLDGEEVLGTATLVRRVQWIVVVELPATEVYAPVRRLILVMGSATVIGAIAAALLGIAFSRSITIPLQRLTEATTRMSAGHLDSRVNVQAENELGDVAQSFNQMAGRLQEAFTDLEAANTELEHRVEQRTLELKQANAEITKLNDQLKAENVRLGTELEVARRLQQMILPKANELEQIPGLDIAGFMESAEEIGGDYYDVLQHNGSIKIGIGDVTGHGLSSGVLMLMVQTAVRTLLIHNETDPIKFLTTLNRTIYDNVQRMNSHKNLTLTLLDYQAGMLRLSGQHEELIVVRADGTIERIDTIDLGFPLGLERDISAFISETNISLNSHDIAVLYTDGVVEAMNSRREQYGLERFCQILQQSAHKSAREIQQAVIEDVWRHVEGEKQQDDITLVVLKQK